MKEGGRSNADQRRGNPQLGILIFQTLFKLQTIKSRAVRREPRKNHEKNLKRESLHPLSKDLQRNDRNPLGMTFIL